MNTAFLVIDEQNDFCKGGALAVPDADGIVPGINAFTDGFEIVIFTQDWHPEGHSSFASSHEQYHEYDVVKMPYGPQVLWPDHCIQGSAGAEFHEGLNQSRADAIVRKGFRPEIDSYSAFFENDNNTPTGLEGYLRTREITDLVLVGLATDFCVSYSAMDAVSSGFNTSLNTELCRAIDLNNSLEQSIADMKEAGVQLNG